MNGCSQVNRCANTCQKKQVTNKVNAHAWRNAERLQPGEMSERCSWVIYDPSGINGLIK